MLAPILKGNRKHDFIHQVEEHGRRKKGLSGEYEKIPIQSKLCVSYTLYSKDRYKSFDSKQSHAEGKEKSAISSKRTMSMQLCVCVCGWLIRTKK